MTRTGPADELGRRERQIMDIVHRLGSASVANVLKALPDPPTYSSVRSMLGLLEQKGYLTHEIEGRTFVYKASDARQNVAVRAVKGIIDRFCGGSAEELVLGMVDNAVLDRKQLERLARKIAERTDRKGN